MSRRRKQLPWIQIWSRPLIGAIAILGAILTAYLTVSALSGASVACTAEAAGSGCNNVLSSSYAKVFGLPLSLFGLLAYLSMATFSLGPLAVDREQQRSLRNKLENWTWLLLLAGATSMTVFSGYLMYVLATELQTACPYCIGSAAFAVSMLILVLLGREWEDSGQVIFTGIVVGLVTLVGTLGVYSEKPVVAQGDRIVITQPTSPPTPGKGWQIDTQSGEAEIALAEHLTAVGAKKYGAFWCPHCHEQKQLFGKEAFQKIDYIECADPGTNVQSPACKTAGVRSYPSWEIDGELYPGLQTPEELAALSGYEGPSNFKYLLPGRS
ncbi:putative membrane protein [Rubidibacter lacunae KORDI 51-2]|uniref:Putative membrane protein n=1 Tax=Rubidibacter lacunae KORDI 51-2 TaxID=582515 RepID=U5DPH2_9CHRO|nr:vitamin K epoxide reductase family protein [Rubidibacter lacunae]ERN41585.1 putative membrane protein [Rubidibacter lacunae KORDI 51-2]